MDARQNLKNTLAMILSGEGQAKIIMQFLRGAMHWQSCRQGQENQSAIKFLL